MVLVVEKDKNYQVDSSFSLHVNLFDLLIEYHQNE